MINGRWAARGPFGRGQGVRLESREPFPHEPTNFAHVSTPLHVGAERAHDFPHIAY